MVQVAATVIEDTRRIPAPVSSISRNTNRMRLDGSLHLSASLNSTHTSNLESSTVGLTGTGLSSVGIGRFSGQSMVLNIGKTLVVETSIATIISVGFGAIHNLLLGEINGLTLEKSPRFEDTDSTESPAGSTRALILHTGDLALSNPINITNDGIEGSLLTDGRSAGLGVEEDSFELSIMKSRELVKAHLVGLALISVVSVDDFKILEEDDLAVGILFGRVGNVELLLPVGVVILTLDRPVVEGSGGEQCYQHGDGLLVHKRLYIYLRTTSISTHWAEILRNRGEMGWASWKDEDVGLEVGIG